MVSLLTFSIQLPAQYSDYSVSKLAGYGTTEGEGFGYSSVTVNGVRPGAYTTGDYLFHVRVLESSTNTISYKIILDGDTVKSGNGYLQTSGSGSQPYFNVEYRLPFSSDFQFDITLNNECNDRKSNLDITKYSSTSLETVWNPSVDEMTLSFVKGAEFMSFAEFINDSVGTVLGKEINILYDDINSIVVVPDNDEINPYDREVIIMAQVLGIEHTASFNLPEIPYEEIYYFVNGPNELFFYYGTSVSYEILLNGIDPLCPNYAIPPDRTVDIGVTRGEEFINLYDFADTSFTPRKALNGLPAEGEFLVSADGSPVDMIDTAVIRLSTNSTDITPVEIIFTINPPELKVEAIPPTISTDDSTQLSFLQLRLDGTYSPFPPEQLFNIYNDTPEYGILYSIAFDEFSEALIGVPGDVKFYSEPDITKDTVYAEFFVETIIDEGAGSSMNFPGSGTNESQLIDDGSDILESKKGNAKLNAKTSTDENRIPQTKDMSTTGKMILSPKLKKIIDKKSNKGGKKQTEVNQTTFGTRPIFGTLEIPIIKKDSTANLEILLGETKYLGLRKSGEGENTKYEIAEISTEYGVAPQFPKDDGWIWIKNSDVWSGDPVEIQGDKSGIYWEKKYFDGSTNENKEIEAGMIRIIGRFWEEGKEEDYKVTLTAKDGDTSVKIVVTVIKPVKLGEQYNYSRNVFDEEISIDSLCIYNGGRYGIPPQIIKGQMHKETAFKNSFRYEPRIDINTQNNKSLKKKYFDSYDYYTVTSENMGSVTMPTSHTNVQPVSYVTSPKKISEYLIERIKQYIQYPREKNKYKPVFVGYKILTNELQKAFEYYKKTNKDIEDLLELTNMATDSLKIFINSKEFEDSEKYAQTRIMSSYGMLQQTFYNAHDSKLVGFSVSNQEQSPELLNEINFSLKAYKENMTKLLEKRSNNSWAEGYEMGWGNILDRYNKGETNYELDVLENSKLYLPKK